MSRKINIQDSIGIFDGYILDQECDKIINHFEEQDKFQKTFTREKSENASVLAKKDNQLFLNSSNLTVWKKEFKTILANFDIALKHYEKETGILDAYGINDFEFCPLKIQKTLPSQGYHTWHIDHSNSSMYDAYRALVFSIFLNTIEEGGETEFLHQSIRVKPVKGRCVIWPAGFPYVHRGNPPLKDTKYIITSWLSLPMD